jgi:hypothetical protein
MDPVTRLPVAHSSVDPLDRDLVEVDAAISLVVAGLATRVRLVALGRPDRAASVALARAQAAGIRFEVDHGVDGTAAMTVGPRLPGVG